MKRRHFLAGSALGALSACLAGNGGRLVAEAAAASTPIWPSQPIRIINSYPPGGIVDILARLIGAEITKTLGQPVIVEDKPGAGGNIGTAYAARAAGDPYTLLLGASGPLAINVSLYNNLTYDPRKDFTPITLLAATPLVLVTSAKSGIDTIDELVTRLRDGDKPPFYGSAGTGTPQHLAGELLKQKLQVQATHVAYKGGAPAVIAVLGGEVLYAFENLALVQSHIQAGRLRALAVSSPHRTALLPDTPTMTERVAPGFEARGWYGLLAPAGIPAEVAARLTEATIQAAHVAKVRQVIESFGSEDVAKGPAEFSALIASEIMKWRGIIAAGNIKLEG